VPPGSALKKGLARWEHRSRFTLAPRYTSARRAKEEEWIWRESLKKKKGKVRVKGSKIEHNIQVCKSSLTATMQVY